MSNSDILVAFDLDDTLYKERDYVRSGHVYVAREVARETGIPTGMAEAVVDCGEDGEHPFDRLHGLTGVPVERMVEMYRGHMPSLELPAESSGCLERLLAAGVTLALITDGRHRGQWNKISSLGLERYFDRRLISVSDDVGGDKTDAAPWMRMEALTPMCGTRWYVGDNPRKDFHHPRLLGWNTVMLLDNGLNIKSQVVELPDSFKAEYSIISLDEIPDMVLGV